MTPEQAAQGPEVSGSMDSAREDLREAVARLEASVRDPVSMTADDVFYCQVRQDDLRTILAALPQGEEEPVAWRWRHTPEAYGTPDATPGSWNLQITAPSFPVGRADITEVQPLYLHPAPPAPDRVSEAARDVLAERARQVGVEGWTPEHDDQHDAGQLSQAASCYAGLGDRTSLSVTESKTVPHHYEHNGRAQADDLEWYPAGGKIVVPRAWPWEGRWWKPRDHRSNLVRAGALILAEIERLDRAALQQKDSADG